MAGMLTNSDFQERFSDIHISETELYVKVILIEGSGQMYTLWLPNVVSGRYTFQDRAGIDCNLPLYIEREHGEWIAYLGKNARFYGVDESNAHEKILYDKMIAKISYQKQEYALFVEIQEAKGEQFLFYSLTEQMEYTIGRQPEKDIYYPCNTVSRNHALLKWQDGVWNIIDDGSANGIYLNGIKVKSAKLYNGDSVFIMGLYILMGTDFIAVNNANGRVKINNHSIHQINVYSHLVYPERLKNMVHNEVFDRQPHKQMKLNPAPIHIDSPPMPLYSNNIPLLLRMGSPVVMGGQALMTGNFAMALTSLIFPALTQGITEKERKEYEEKRTTMYRKYLAEKAKEIFHEKKSEERMLNDIYPALSTVLNFALTKERLWERRKTDDDFLNVRIGTGCFSMIAEKKFQEKRFEIERDGLQEEMYVLAEQPVLLENVPIMLSLQKDYIIGILGISKRKIKLIDNIIMQIVLTHSYDEVKLVLMVEQQDAVLLDYVRYLPHNWDNDRNVRFFAATQADALQISEYLGREMEEIKNKQDQKNIEKKMPAYVVVCLSKKLFDCVEIFKELLFEDEYCNVSILAAFDGIPKECSKIIDLRQIAKVIDFADPESDEQTFALDQYDVKLAHDSMRALMKMKLKMESQSYLLPDALGFLEMFGASRVEHLNPLKRWKDNNPVNSLSAMIGVGTNGQPFTLDLHQNTQGPHGLVAGMTGSGKSEFLITYILSMAVNYSPDEVAFILIDYKGGGLADAFEDKARGIHLPHLVGTITNLDGSSIQRSLMSIQSELTRRQMVFKEAKSQSNEGTMDIYDYQRLYRNKKVSEPMPHLFIIADEFAELKQQQQEFMDELISAARIGRSLGVHLILATQKPGGVVNDQIWSNTKFRVCLRVQDRGDSIEMLKRPEAAELKHTGRFYLQVGYNEYFALGQSAWCGGDYIPQDELPAEQDHTVRFIDNTGQTILDVRPNTGEKKAEYKQVVAIVQYLSDLAKQEKIEPKSLWKDSLPKEIELGVFLENTPIPETEKISALIGLVDDPEYQRQFPFILPLQDFYNMLLVGTSGSGKSTLIRTMLYSLIYRYSPEDVVYYIIDLSDGALRGYSHTPHCGAYLTHEDDSNIGRLLTFIHELITRRKKMFAEAEISDFGVYRQMKPLPYILFIVDGFMNLKNLQSGEKYFLLFQDYLREGTSFGVRFILSCNHDNEVGAKSKQELDYRIALQAKDRYAYGDILDVRCTYAPPVVNGRGLCLQDKRPLEYHTAMLDCDKPEQDRAELLKKKLSHLAQAYSDYTPVERLPMADMEQSYEEFCLNFDKERIPLGYMIHDMKTVAIPFQQLHSISLYFGNPKGVSAIFHNLLVAAQKNHMDVTVIRRNAVDADGKLVNSVFDLNAEQCAIRDFHDRVTIYECTRDNITKLSDKIQQEIIARNVYRDEYSIQQGIPLERKGRSQKAAKYIRKHSIPMFIIIERFADFCQACKDEQAENNGELEGLYGVYFNQMRGYNIYFAAGFYPEDGSNLSRSGFMKQYNAEEFFMLFGGRYDKIPIQGIPYEITKADALQTEYNRFWMKYREGFYPVLMPCGKLEVIADDPDEQSIV